MQRAVKVKIRGTAPYLQHRFVVQEKGRTKTIYDPLEDATEAAYKNEDGFYIPSRQIKAALTKAAVDYKYKGKKSFKQYIKAGTLIEPNEIPLSNEEFEIHSSPVVVQRARIMRSRPMFREWEAEFKIILLDDVIDTEVLKMIIESAGRFNGIGDFRPEYGRFELVSFEVAE